MRRRDTCRLLAGLLSIGVLVACGSTSTDPATSTASEVQIESAPARAVEPEPEPDLAGESEPAAGAEVDANDGLYPTVVDASATTSDGTSWRFDVTLLSEYDSPQRYADAWRVLDGDDNELGIRVLTHDHAGEQPFTRSHSVDVPVGITTVFIEGRDQDNGWSGERFELNLTR